MISRRINWCLLGLRILVVATASASIGCSTRNPPPSPPPFNGVVMEYDIGEVSLADTLSASCIIDKPITLPRKAMLRIKGVYRFVEAAKDLPVNIDITGRSRSGSSAIYSSGASGPVKRDDGKYAFTTDIPAPVSGSGEFELTLRAGKRFIAHGKVIVKD